MAIRRPGAGDPTTHGWATTTSAGNQPDEFNELDASGGATY
jgi:hypothetical protein